MRGVVRRQDGEHVQPFERIMTSMSAKRLDLDQEIGSRFLFASAPLLNVDPLGRSERLLIRISPGGAVARGDLCADYPR
jgi:hypothetical protein